MTQVVSALWMAQSAGLLASLIMVLLIYRLGRGGFSRSLFFVGASVGAIMGATIALMLAPLHIHDNPLAFSAAMRAFTFAGFPEEAAKVAGLYLLVRPYYLRRSARDLALGAASIALGFALLENSLYIATAGANWQALVTARAFVSAPFHLLLGLASAMAFVDAHGREIARPSALRLGGVWIALSLLHGAFDFAIMAMPTATSIAAVVRLAQLFGVDAPAVLAAAAFAATAITGLAAYVSLRRLDRSEPDGAAFSAAGRAWWARALLSRSLGIVIAGVLILSAALFILGAVYISFVGSDSGAVEIAIGLLAVPLTIGVLIARWPRPSLEASARARKRRRWALRGLAAAAAVAALAVVAFPTTTLAPLRYLQSTRYAVDATRLAAKADLEAAVGRLDRAIAWRSDAPELWVARANLRAQLGRLAEAEADYDAALRLTPGNSAFLAARAETRLTMGDVNGALADIDAALALDPNNATLWTARVTPDLASGDFARAEEDATHAARLDGNNPKVAFAKAQIAIERGDYKSASNALSRRYNAGVDITDLLFTDGRAHFYLGNPPVAERRFASIAPRSSNIYPTLWLALAERRQGRASPELAARLAKQPPTAWPSRLARLLLGQASEAETLAGAANDPQRCEFHFYAGELRLGRGDKDGAREELATAKAMCPFNYVEGEGARAQMRELAAAG